MRVDGRLLPWVIAMVGAVMLGCQDASSPVDSKEATAELRLPNAVPPWPPVEKKYSASTASIKSSPCGKAQGYDQGGYPRVHVRVKLGIELSRSGRAKRKSQQIYRVGCDESRERIHQIEMLSQNGPIIVGLGEALFDCFEDRNLLGGAPVNFTVHAHRLLAPHGGRGVLVSRVGDDPLGKELLAEVESRGISTNHIQTDPRRPTGRVNVVLSDEGQPTYDIAEEVAWDYLAFEESLQSLAKSCHAVCFGTLAQRSSVSRAAIGRFLADATQAIKLFDVNLRQNYFSAKILSESLDAATAVKLNEEELIVIGELLDVAGGGQCRQDQLALRFLDRFHLNLLALTRGSEGTVLYQGQERVEGTPAAADGSADADSVGAGDACCAGIVVGMLSKWPLQQTADLANRMGAFVASQPGGTPELSIELLELAAEKHNPPPKT